MPLLSAGIVTIYHIENCCNHDRDSASVPPTQRMLWSALEDRSRFNACAAPRLSSMVRRRSHAIMDMPIVKVLLLVLVIGLWILSLRSLMAGRWLGEIGNIRRDNHPIWFWCG